MKFTYVGDDTRVYPDLSLEVAPGDEVDLDEAPADGRWKPSKAKPSTTTADQEA